MFIPGDFVAVPIITIHNSQKHVPYTENLKVSKMTKWFLTTDKSIFKSI